MVAIAGVLFDLDGTLVRSPIDFAGMKRAVRELAAGYGVDAASLHAKDVLGLVEEAARALDARASQPNPRHGFAAAFQDPVVAVALDAVREASLFEGAPAILA